MTDLWKTGDGAQVIRTTWYSQTLRRKKTVSVILPPGYSVGGVGYGVLYLLHGYGWTRETWINRTDLVEVLNDHNLITVLPESRRYWFINDSEGRRYEDYLIGEVVAFTDLEFNTMSDRKRRAIGGFSMGGASALFNALRHPDLFSVVCCQSGAFEAPMRIGDPYRNIRQGQSGVLMPSVESHERVWGPPGSATREEYNPYRLIAARDRELAMSVYLDIGRDDFPRMVEMTRRLRVALTKASVCCEYAVRPGGHDINFVSSGLRKLICFVQRAFSA